MSNIGQERYVQVIQVIEQHEPHAGDVDYIEYEPEEAANGAVDAEVIYEYVEIENEAPERPKGDFVDATRYTCSNRQCKRNNVAFGTKEQFDAHNEFHLEQYRNSICPICNKELASVAKLATHIELRHKLRDFTCDHCGKVFRSKDNLRLHMTHHRRYFYVECRACNRGYKSMQSLRYHLRQHFEHHQCETCGKVFEHKKLLVGHVAAMHDQALQVQCRFCTRMFSRSDVRDTHEREIHKNGAVASHFKCNECDEAFDLRDDLTSHKILNHFSGVIHTCSECGKNFKKKSLLDLHMSVHRKKSISCDVCKQMFTFLTGLNKHRKLGRCKGPPTEKLADVLTREEIARIAKQQLKEITVNPRRWEEDEEAAAAAADDEGAALKFNDDDGEEEEEEEAAQPAAKEEVVVQRKKPGRKPKAEKAAKPVCFEQVEDTNPEHEAIVYEPVTTTSSGRVVKRKLPSDLPAAPSPHASLLRTGIVQAQRPPKPKPAPLVCDVCGMEASSKPNLVAHFATHARHRSRHTCSVCDAAFGTMQLLHRHIRHEHPNSGAMSRVKKFACDLCEKRYLTRHLLAIHKKSHENLKEFKCPHDECRYATNSPYDLNNHVKRIHNPTKAFGCPNCAKKFKRRCDMINHNASVHSDMKVYVKCPVCAKIILERSLQSHLINRHSEKAHVKPYECAICGKRERYVRTLQRHIDAVHEPKDRGVTYKCPECPATFFRRRDLNAHSFEHYSGDVHECAVCGNKYRSKKELTNHEYTHRRVEFPCPICKRVFQTKSGRSKHVKKHVDGDDVFTEGEGVGGGVEAVGAGGEEVVEEVGVNEGEVVYEQYEILEEVEPYVNIV